jgi:hypothetical protein
LAAKGFVLLFRDAQLVLVDEDADQLVAFVTALRNASDEYGAAVELGEAWDRPAVPFHVVLQASAEASSEAARRWLDTGAQLGD